LAFDYTQPINLFWDWYVKGEVGYSIYEAASLTSLRSPEVIPWQLMTGFNMQFGQMKNWQVSLGIGGSSEHYASLVGTSSYELKSLISGRAHIGMNYRFLSMVGMSSIVSLRYFYPFTPVKHDSLDITYRGILDANLRMMFPYDSWWSLFGGFRLEDYKTSDGSVTYFATKIYFGAGIHF
jgi:hypothetical protein